MCIFVYFHNIVDKPQQFTEGDNKDVEIIILIIKDEKDRQLVWLYIGYSLGDAVEVATTDKVI